jgi:hypothetical protein
MADYYATFIDKISLILDETVTLESLRQAVVPPYFMLMPFIKTPDQVQMVMQTPLEEDGIHGVVYTLHAESCGEGELRLGFRDMRTGAITHEKTIHIYVIEEEPSSQLQYDSLV